MMGARHVRGLGELKRVWPGHVRLAAVCDRRLDLAEKVAAEAEELLGERPAVYDDLEQALREQPSLQAADVVTDPRTHDDIVVGLLAAGLEVLCEKPLAITVARGRRMVEAAQRHGRLLATAENNRHDPMNRLAGACIADGLIGHPSFALQLAIGSAYTIIGTAWRHKLAAGGVLLDVGIHAVYMLEALMGPVATVAGEAQLVHFARTGKEYDGTEVAVDVDAEDACTAALSFANGAQGHLTVSFASAGQTLSQRTIFGSAGTLGLPGDRTGAPVVLHRQGAPLPAEQLLELAPSYRLNEVETQLFGDHPLGYSFPYPETDRKLLAAEFYSFARAVTREAAPEADGAQGLRALAVTQAIMESAAAGRKVTVAEVLDGSLHEYQDRIEDASMA
jgi:predicted dehydrogenase